MSKTKIPISTRATVQQRADDRCEYCKAAHNISSSAFHVEHIHPEILGGTSDLTNLAWSCGGCNDHKQAAIKHKDPETGILVPLFNPRTQSWKEHFAWNQDFTEIVGLTPEGRATRERLHFNRPNLIRQRRLLYKNGDHPPEDTV